MTTENSNSNLPKSKLFTTDFFQKLILLAFGFLLTTIVGAFLSFYFQSKSSYNNYKSGLIESERKVSTGTASVKK